MECAVESDPLRFLARVTPFLADDRVANYQLIVMLKPWIEGPAAVEPDLGIVGGYACDDAGEVVGVAVNVRTARSERVTLSAMPPAATVALEEALWAVNPGVRVVTGPHWVAGEFAGRRSARTGRPFHSGGRMRIHVLRELAPAPSVPGSPRPVGDDDMALLARWWVGYESDVAARSAGRSASVMTVDRLRRSGELFLWEVDGAAKAMVGYFAAPWRIASILAAYTPPEHRRRGYYAAALHATIAAALNNNTELMLRVTDPDYAPTNATMRAMGFEPSGGELHNFFFADPGEAP